jgi:hypothetical protein
MVVHEQLRINGVLPPDGKTKWTGKIARSVLSNYILDSGEQGLSEVFQHTNSGKLIQKQAPIRFGGGRNGFSLTLVYDIEDEVKAKLVMSLIDFASSMGGVLVPCSLECKIQESKQYVHYNSSIVMGRRPRNKEEDKHTYRSTYNKRLLTDEAFLESELKWTITKGIVRQLREYIATGDMSVRAAHILTNIGEYRALPGADQLTRDLFEDFMDDIKIHKAFNLSPEKKCLPRFSVEFSMPIELYGHWAVGGNNHSGFGHILKLFREQGDD